MNDNKSLLSIVSGGYFKRTAEFLISDSSSNEDFRKILIAICGLRLIDTDNKKEITIFEFNDLYDLKIKLDLHGV